MDSLPFVKMSGAGNDFVVIDNRALNHALTKDQIARLCDRHFGVGADGILAVEPSDKPMADFRMRYYNADGGEAEMCGNGARCFARFATRITGKQGQISFETPAGIIRAACEGENVKLEMSDPHDLTLDRHVQLSSGNLTVHSVNTGVPGSIARSSVASSGWIAATVRRTAPARS